MDAFTGLVGDAAQARVEALLRQAQQLVQGAEMLWNRVDAFTPIPVEADQRGEYHAGFQRATYLDSGAISEPPVLEP